MARNIWQHRIRRAETLAAQYSFAAEILGFYQHLARFQQELYQRIERENGSNPPGAGGSLAVEWANRPRTGQFPEFLSVIQKHAPETLSRVASELHTASPDVWNNLLDSASSAAGTTPSTPAEFLALAFLQPYAEFGRSRANLQLDGYSAPFCPFCNRKPALGVLRQQGDAGRRSLICGFCLTEWEFRRIVCPGCGEEDHAKLPVYTAETFPHIRVECCDTCNTYIKSIDLTKNGLAEPLVDELASVPLNLWAQEHGYAKLHPNLLGM